MALLPRYLHAIRGYLPKAQADDIIAEISDSIQSRMEDKAAQAGRALTPDEEAEILQAYGHPLVVASRYWKQQYLIGPELMPFYLRTLKISLIVMVALNVAIYFIVATAKADALSALVGFWSTVWGSAFLVFGIVTIVFALLERYRPKDGVMRWNPRSLPAVLEERVPRLNSAFEFVINGAVAAWLLSTPSLRESLGGPVLGSGLQYVEGLPFEAPWLHRLLGAFLVVAVSLAVLALINLARPDWYRLRVVVLIATNTLLSVVAASILAMGRLVAPGAGPSPVEDMATAVQALNGVSIAFVASLCFGCAVAVVLNVRQLITWRSRNLNLGLNGGSAS